MSIRYKRTNWVRLGRLLPAWLLAGFISSLAFAVPVTTNYQGYLENTDGEPLDATVNMTFALYAAAQGGSALWTETHQNVEVTDGVFSLILGDTTSFDDNSLEGKRYLGVTVGSDQEMAPRQQLTSAFFAMRAGVADSVKADSVETEAIADGAVTADKIAPQTITGDRIADGVTITAEERQKLVDLETGGVGSDPIFENVVVKEQLNVEKRIKVGENSLYLGQSKTGTDNSIYTDGGPLVIQDNTQKVGIGTDNPKMKLEVWDTIKVSASGATGGNEGLFMHYDAEKEQAEILATFYPGTNNYTELQLAGNPVVINNSEWADYNVGIGTDDPQAKLQIIYKNQDANGKTLVLGPTSSSNLRLGYHSNYSWIQSHGSKPLAINPIGNNVGIGTTNPQAKLDVAGRVIVRGSDFVLGIADGRSIGNKTFQRALVHGDPATASTPTDTLVINYNGDFEGGTVIQSSLDVRGNIAYHGSKIHSDRRWKKDITPLKNSLEKVSKLQGVNYQWDTENYQKMAFGEEKQVGFIAQDVEPVIPELVSTDSDGYKSISYEKITAVLVEAVKELKAQNDALKAIVCEDHPEEAICQ